MNHQQQKNHQVLEKSVKAAKEIFEIISKYIKVAVNLLDTRSLSDNVGISTM